ncbi:MAG: type II toxin-antitoxin system RelB/DinJ family antitoxin [Peptococcaceae bacterium]|jgi:DNA-damage-inducible protein J|nr:type II toxin-antitoxin system RelB/DinJ family antitoxin [Peptococcaceae bacterium]
MKTTNYNIRLAPDVKSAAEKTFAAFGLNLSEAINVFLHKSIMERGFPFEVRESPRLTENGYTPEFEAAILAEAEEAYAAVANGTAKLYKNAAELFCDLDAEGDADDGDD